MQSRVGFVFKTMVLSMAGMILVFLLVGSMLASRWSVDTHRVLAAKPDRVAAAVLDFGTWQDWCRLEVTMGPETQREVQGKPGEVGHALVWTGRVGTARLELSKAEAGRAEFVFHLQMQGEVAWLLGTHSVITWTAEGDGTKVDWLDEGEFDTLALRWFGWFGAIQEGRRQSQVSSLQGLERFAAAPTGSAVK